MSHSCGLPQPSHFCYFVESGERYPGADNFLVQNLSLQIFKLQGCYTLKVQHYDHSGSKVKHIQT